MKRYRKYIAALLVLVLMLSGCGKVTEAEEAIAAIGTVTMESEAAIIYAEHLVANLSENQQAKLTNLSVLTKAREDYDRKADLIQQTEAAIAAIGTVTADSDTKIAKARNLYHALISEKLDSYVSHLLPILEAAEASYDQVLIQNAYDEAVSTYESGKYKSAQNLFINFIDKYPDNELTGSATEMIVMCFVRLAEEEKNNGRLDSALIYLYEALYSYDTQFFPNEFLDLYDEIIAEAETLRPETGYCPENTIDSGYPEFTMENKSDQDVCVKLEMIDNPEKYVLLYVRANDSATINMENGEYSLKYTTGSYWFGDDIMFGSLASYSKAATTVEFETIYHSGSVEYSAPTYTILGSEGGGNTYSTDIGADDF